MLYQEKQKAGTVTAVHAAAVRQKLLQIASGAVYGDSDNDPGPNLPICSTPAAELTMDVAMESPFSW